MSYNKTDRQQRRSDTRKYQTKQTKLHSNSGWGDPTPKQIGRWTTLSWRTCGRTLCSMCGNPRNTKWTNKFEQLTLPERKSQESFDYALKMLYNSYNTNTDTYGEINEISQ